MSLSTQAGALLEGVFGPGIALGTVSVPGRIAVIGDHIDYHDLPVMAMAMQRRLHIAFRTRADQKVMAVSADGYGRREFTLAEAAAPSRAGDWVNYLKAAVNAAQLRWPISRGLEAAIVSDLPPAAGLSSSSALVTGFIIAALKTNGIQATVGELMEILPDAEQFVGTRGGGMDHAAILASRADCVLLIGFSPLEMSAVQIPAGWSFMIAHSLVTAEKSGATRSEYNARRSAGARALKKLGFASYREALLARSSQELIDSANGHGGDLTDEERRAFHHVVSEGTAVQEAVAALKQADAARFGQLLFGSHVSLRDQLRVSRPGLDEIVEISRDAGALGARVTGAGFGGCAVIFCRETERDQIRDKLIQSYYSKHNAFDPHTHLIPVEPSRGAMLG